MGSSRQTPPGQFQTAQTGPQMGPPTPNGQHPQSPFAPGGAMDPMRPAAPSWNPAAQTQANLRGNQRTRAELEALRYPNGRPGATQPPQASMPMGAEMPTESIGQPAPPIQNNTPSFSAVEPTPTYGAAGPVNNAPVSTTAPTAPTLSTVQAPMQNNTPTPGGWNNAPQLNPINQNAGPGGKGGTANAPQYSHLTGLLGGRGG